MLYSEYKKVNLLRAVNKKFCLKHDRNNRRHVAKLMAPTYTYTEITNTYTYVYIPIFSFEPLKICLLKC